MIGERAADRVWPPELRRTLVLLGLACALEAFAYTVCVPFLTASLRADTGASTTVVAAVFIAHTLGSTLATPFVPRFIRSCGGCARGTALALVLLGTSEATCAFSRTAPVLFGARLVAGLAGGLVWSSVLSACALLARRHGGMASMFGSVIACVSVGTMAGPTVGGPLFRAAGWPAPFCAVALMCVALAAVVARAVERLPLTPPPAAVAVKLAAGCEGRATSLVLGSVCVGAVLFSSIDAVLPLLIEDALGDADRARFGPAGARTGPSGAPYALSTSLVFCAISVRARKRRCDAPPR
jgi:predicted MFS family arabinose efflux permease